MTTSIQDELHAFAVGLLERRGGLVEWADPAQEGTALLTAEMAELLHADADVVRLSSEPTAGGLCVSLATDFLDTAASLLWAEPQIGTFCVPQTYLKRGRMDDAVSRAFTWLNVKVKLSRVVETRVEYHTWWFRASITSEDRWETCFPTTINSSSGVEVDIPDPLGIWELQPRQDGGKPVSSTYLQATARAQSRIQALAADFIARMEARLGRDQKRLREYYNALLREASNKKARGNTKPDPEKLEARKRAVHLELRRKLAELDERYALEAALAPIVLIRTEIPSLAVDLSVFRKRASRNHTVFWNPLLKRFEPLRCSQCGTGAFCVAFTNDEVEPLCPACAS